LKVGRDRGWEAYGIEVSKWAADCGRTTYNLDIRNIKLESVEEVWGKGFDAITLNHVAEHLHHPTAVFKMIFKILNDKGILLVDVPNELEGFMYNIVGNLGRKYIWYRSKEPTLHHTYFYTKDSLIKVLDKCGFKEIFNRTLNEDMLIRSKIIGGEAIKKYLFKIGGFFNQGPVIEILAKKKECFHEVDIDT